jgi:hypothetical protein
MNASEVKADLIRFTQEARERYATGYSIDDACGKVGDGEMALIWARSGSGKSTWALNIVANTPHVPTVVVSAEMTPRRQFAWLTAMTVEGLPCQARNIEKVLRRGPDRDDRYPAVRAALDRTAETYPYLHFIMPSRPTIKELALTVYEVEDRTGMKVGRVFLDHMGLLDGCTNYEAYEATAGDLAGWARQDDFGLYVIQQTGRSGGGDQRNDGHIPVTLSSGVYAGEAHADFIFGLYRPDRDPALHKEFYDDNKNADRDRKLAAVKGLTRLQVIKNRPFGMTEERGVVLEYQPSTMRLEESLHHGT